MKKIIWYGKMSQTHFSLKLLAMKLESNKNADKMAAKTTVYYKNIR